MLIAGYSRHRNPVYGMYKIKRCASYSMQTFRFWDCCIKFQVLHFICSLFYPISSRCLTIFVNYVRFTLFIVLYFIISQWFSFYTSTTFLWHVVSHSYNVMVSFAFFVFVRHTAHCFLLLVSCMLYVVKNIALRKPTWIGGWNVG